MKRLLFLGILLLVSIPIFGQTNSSAQGWCEQGGNHLVVNPGITSTGFVQASFPQCTVTVYIHGTVAPAVIFADDKTPPTPLGNPFTATTFGHWQFYAVTGNYDVVLSGAGFTSPFTLTDVLIPTLGVIVPACNPATPLAAAITSAYNLLPNTGGIIDCSLSGTSTLLSDPFSPMIKNVTVIMPIGTISAAIALNIPSNVTYQQNQGGCLNNSSPATFRGAISAGLYQIFCGSAIISILSNTLIDYPQWFGAVGDGVHDDAPAINNALIACRGPKGASQYLATCKTQLTGNTFRLQEQIAMFANETSGAYSGLELCGISKLGSTLAWAGPTNVSVIRMIGTNQLLCDLKVLGTTTGWLDAIQYDGQNSPINIGISTGGKLQNIQVECDGVAGNAFTFGRNHFQADQVDVEHPTIIGCNLGIGIAPLDPNAVDITVISPSISFCWIAIGGAGANNSKIDIFGGEIEDNDLNFFPPNNGTLTVVGVRSETSKKSLSTPVGATFGNITLINYLVPSTYWSSFPAQPRPATNGTSVDTTHVTLSVGNSVTFGDYITIAGAGTGGTLLHTHIASMTDPFHIVLDQTSIVTMVTNAAINLDTTVEQNQINFQAGGPLVISGGYYGSTQGENAITVGNGTVVLDGVGFAENFTYPNPVNVNTNTSGFLPNVTWRGLWYNNTPTTRMPDYFNTVGLPTVLFTTNVGAGVNNAWVLTNAGQGLVNGLKIGVIVPNTTGLTMQNGANTISYNGSSTFSVNKASSATNITGVSQNSYVEFVFDATNGGLWRLLGQ